MSQKYCIRKINELFPVCMCTQAHTMKQPVHRGVKSARCHICSTVSSAGSAGSPGWLWQYLAADSCASLTRPLLRCSNTDTKSAYTVARGTGACACLLTTHTHVHNYTDFVCSTISMRWTFVAKCTSGELWLSLIHSSLTLTRQCLPWREAHSDVGTYVCICIHSLSSEREKVWHASCLD